MSRSSRLTAEIRILTAAVALATLATILSCGESPVAPAGGSTLINANGSFQTIYSYPDSVVHPASDREPSIAPSLLTNGGAVSAAASVSVSGPTYTVTSVPFAPEVAPTTGPLAPTQEFAVSQPIPIGFTFAFFGNNYTELQIGAGGLIGFGTGSIRDGCCSGRFIPRVDAFYKNFIAVGWSLWVLNGKSVRYETRGVAPNRRFVVQFNNLTEDGGTGVFTAQLVLYEHTNDIVIYTTALSTSAKSHAITQGIENLAGTEAAYVAGRDSARFAISNDGVKFKLVAVNTAPVVVQPANLAVDLGTGVCAANVTVLTPTVNDDAPGATLVGVRSDNLALNAAYPKGVTTITWTATDVEGLTGNATQTVTVSDKQKPVITAPAAIAVRTDPKVSLATVDPGVATASDNCPNVAVAGARSDNAPLAARFPLGVTTITWTATDASNNTASATQTITVSPNTPPVITVPAPVSFNTDPGQCSAKASLVAATATDDLPGVVVTAVRNDGKSLDAAYPKGVTIVTWTATDVDGASTSGTQSVTVVDKENPSISAPANVSVGNDAGKNYATVSVGSPVTGDNCTQVTVSSQRSDGRALSDSYPVGSTSIKWTVVDAAGNSASASQSVVVNDVEAPHLVLPSDFWVNATMPSGAVVTFTVNATDNVGVTALSCEPASGSVYSVGYHTVSCSASDAAGNTAHGSFGFEVIGPAEQMQSLMDFIISLNLSNGVQNPLVNQLRAALRDGTDPAACTKLDDFIHMVGVKDSGIPMVSAQFMVSEAQRIKGALGCAGSVPSGVSMTRLVAPARSMSSFNR